MRRRLPALWPFGQVTVADHRRDADMAAIAARILKDAPPRFALAGLSMGGYIAFAMMRLAPERIARLALLDTSARPDTPEQTAGRKTQIAMAQAGRFGEIPDLSIPRFLHRNRQNDEGADSDRARRWRTRPGRRPSCASRRRSCRGRIRGRCWRALRCPTLVLVGDGDEATPPELNKEIAGGISGREARRGAGLRAFVDAREAGGGECRARNGSRLEPRARLRVVRMGRP